MHYTKDIQIEKVDHEQDAVRRALISHLAARETHNLFILGNMAARFPGSHLYIASRGGEWVGVAAYYELPRSIIPFSTEAETTRALVRHIVTLHRPVEWLCGVDYAARPGLDELVASGFALINDPRQVFMEAAITQDEDIPRCPHEEKARFIEDRDGEAVAHLLRWMQRPDDGSAVTEEETRRALANRQRLVIEVGGQLVCTAATNGVGVTAFQIIGVVTHPEFRRRGYARAVCAALMRHAYRQGARRCALFTDRQNTAAQACYESLGFGIEGDYIVAQVRAPGVLPSRAS